MGEIIFMGKMRSMSAMYNKVKSDFAPGSECQDIRVFVMNAEDGKQREWISQTYISKNPRPYNKWWFTNFSFLGAYCWTKIKKLPENLVKIPEMSGYYSETNQDDYFGHIDVYKDEKTNLIYTVEQDLEGNLRAILEGVEYFERRC